MRLTLAAEPAPLATDADGVARVGGTRITLDTVIEAFQEGATAEEIAQQYPSLQLADVYAVIAYYLRHRADVHAYLRERQQHRAAIHAEIDRRIDRREIRERLLSRRPVEPSSRG